MSSGASATAARTSAVFVELARKLPEIARIRKSVSFQPGTIFLMSKERILSRLSIDNTCHNAYSSQ